MIAVTDEFDPVAEQEGPFVAALICERVLVETDGVVTPMRIIDQVNLERPPSTLPPNTALIPVPFQGALLILLKGGRPGAKHEIAVVAHGPSGNRQQVATQTVDLTPKLEGGVAAANLIVQMRLGLQSEGTYWFEVLLDGRRATASPLRVVLAGREIQSEQPPSPERDSPST